MGFFQGVSTIIGWVAQWGLSCAWPLGGVPGRVGRLGGAVPSAGQHHAEGVPSVTVRDLFLDSATGRSTINLFMFQDASQTKQDF